jgi:predicted transcriptional regulator
MVRIVIDLDLIEDVKNKLDSLINGSQKIETSDYKKLIGQRNFTKMDIKDEIIFEYIKMHPGISKQGLVNALVLTISRTPIFKAVKRLVKSGMIIQRADDASIQKHLLFVNEENLIIQVEKDMKAFKKSYLKLIKRASEEYKKKQNLTEDELKKSKKPHVDIPEIYSSGLADGLSKILKQLIISYSLQAIFVWPNQIKDSESLYRLYLMVFQILNEIFSELVKRVPFDIEEDHERIEYLQEGLQHSYEDAKRYANLIKEFHEYGLDTEFDLGMSDLFTASNMPTKWKEYRGD